jgi:murein DD-endopeptidase MepM/ murein hydrolase activator NlpD
MPRPRRLRRALVVGAALVLVVIVVASPSAAHVRTVAPSADDRSAADASGWVWPVAGALVLQEYVPPAHAYAPGHRGIDLVVPDGAGVRAPADGVIAFAGMVAGRPVVTIDHGGGLVTTLEPVVSSHRVGDTVDRADAIGSLQTGGHVPPGAVHFGVRQSGEYVNPRLLLGGIPRAVLLPCC